MTILHAIFCFVLGHKFYSVLWLSERTEKVRCARCDGLYAINHEMGAILPYDQEMDLFYKRWGTLG